MKALFGFLFAISIGITLGLLYCYTEWQRAKTKCRELQEAIYRQADSHAKEVKAAFKRGYDEHKLVCEDKLIIAKDSAYHQGRVKAQEECEIQIEQAEKVAYERAKSACRKEIKRIKDQHQSPAKKRELSVAAPPVHKTQTVTPVKTASVGNNMGLYNSQNRKNLFVLFMIVLSPVLGAGCLRAIRGDRGWR